MSRSAPSDDEEQRSRRRRAGERGGRWFPSLDPFGPAGTGPAQPAGPGGPNALATTPGAGLPGGMTGVLSGPTVVQPGGGAIDGLPPFELGPYDEPDHRDPGHRDPEPRGLEQRDPADWDSPPTLAQAASPAAGLGGLDPLGVGGATGPNPPAGHVTPARGMAPTGQPTPAMA
ncbi:MAG: hypothetical protein IRZ08_20005, partial [Frankia sp.]|nr:hypothetical protein [Frankia sp.]